MRWTKEMIAYTSDGSKRNGKTGSAWVLWRVQAEEAAPIVSLAFYNRDCTVYGAEVTGLLEAIRTHEAISKAYLEGTSLAESVGQSDHVDYAALRNNTPPIL